MNSKWFFFSQFASTFVLVIARILNTSYSYVKGRGFLWFPFFLSQLEKGWGEAQAWMMVETAEGQHKPDRRHPPRALHLGEQKGKADSA